MIMRNDDLTVRERALYNSMRIGERYPLNDLKEVDADALGDLVSKGLAGQNLMVYWRVPRKSETSVNEITRRLVNYLKTEVLEHSDIVRPSDVLREVLSRNPLIGYQGEGVELAEHVAREYGLDIKDVTDTFWREVDTMTVQRAAERIYDSLLNHD